MAGRIISTPTVRHGCAPGWEWRTAEPGSDAAQRTYGVPPTVDRYPAGTRWQCDDCFTVWVSIGRSPGSFSARFRREGHFERWRRHRREARDA